MNAAPIVERELRVAARRPISHIVRVLAALGAAATAAVVLREYARVGGDSAAAGRELFLKLTKACFWLSLIGGGLFTVDCLSTERREGTLGLLFLSRLTARDIIVGKLAAHSWMAFSALLAVVPVLALTLLLGGVSGTEVVRVSGILATVLFLSLAAGLFVSAFCEGEAEARLGLVALLMGLTLVPLLPGLVLGSAHELAWLSPVTAGLLIDQKTGPRLRVEPLFPSLISVNLLGLLLLQLAALRIKYEASYRSPVPARAYRGDSSGRFGRLSTRYRIRRRRRLLSKHPLLWAGTREPVVGVAATLLLLTVVVPAIPPLLRQDWGAGSPLWMARLLLLAGGVLMWLIAMDAFTRARRLRTSGELEPLLGTTLTNAELIRGLILATLHTVRGPILVFTGFALLWLLTTKNRVHPWSSQAVMVWAMIVVPGIVASGGILWLALWQGLRPARWLFGFLPLLGIGGVAVGAVMLMPEPTSRVGIPRWLYLPLVSALCFGVTGLRARQQIRHRLREVGSGPVTKH